MKNPIVAFLLAVAAVAAVPAKAQYSTYIWKADSLFMCGEYAQSSAMFDKAFQSERDIQGQHLYNAACVAALSGDSDKAFQRLFARLEKEPGWYSETFEQDEDLTSLHGDARWKVFADSNAVRRERVERRYEQPLCQRLKQIGRADQDIRHKYLQAFNAQPRNQAKVDSLEREMPVEMCTRLADYHYHRGNYRQTADLLKLVPEDSLSHEAFRQLCNSYQRLGDNSSFAWWASALVARFPEDGEMVAGLTTALVREKQAWKGVGYAEAYFKQDSTHILVNRALADAYFMDRRFNKSAAMYERLLQLGDSTFTTLYSAGMCYSQMDSLNQAYRCLLPALYLSQMQHANCAYRLGVVSVDLGYHDEGLRYLSLATELMRPDTTIMKAITLSQGEGYYLTHQYDKALEAWKQHLAYNPSSIATYYNIANIYAYLQKDDEQAKAYYQQFLDLARKEKNPNASLSEMIEKAEELLKYYEAVEGKKAK